MKKIIFIIAAVALIAVAGGLLVEQLGKDVVDEGVIAQWRARLTEQQTQVDAMRDRSRAETQAVGRQLAQMQARLIRMEALGARVTEVADLDEGEFAFTEPVPQGGPLGNTQAPLPWSELHLGLTDLARDLQVIERRHQFDS